MTSDAGLARLHDLLDDTDWLKSHSYDPPDDAELSITITAKERRLILAALEDREAKLTALVEALNDALSFINEAGGACLGLAMSGSNHPNPDGVQMDISRRAMTLAHTICQALAHHSAPVGPKPGEIRVVAGKRSRFIEHGDRGEVWEILPDAPPSTPTSAPVEDVAGLVEVVVNDSDETVCVRLGDFVVREIGWGRTDRIETIAAEMRWAEHFEAALIQPQGEEWS